MVFFCDCWKVRPQPENQTSSNTRQGVLWIPFFGRGSRFSVNVASTTPLLDRGHESKEMNKPSVAKPPTYSTVDTRSDCPLLEYCWQPPMEGRDGVWTHPKLLERLQSHPEEAFCRLSTPSGRTALHLATLPGASCSKEAILCILETNPHAVVMPDSNGKTPMWNVCLGKQRDDPEIIQLFVRTAVEIEQIYYTDPTSAPIDFVPKVEDIPGAPLNKACTKRARMETLQLLLSSRKFTQWIAPCTGGESFLYGHETITQRPHISPLKNLWTRDIVGHSNGSEPLTALTSEEETLNNQKSLRHLRRITEAFLSDQRDSRNVNANNWCSYVKPRQIQDDNTGVRDTVIERWYMTLVLLWPHIYIAKNESPSTTTTGDSPHSRFLLLYTVAVLLFPVPDLVKLICRMYPEQLTTAVIPEELEVAADRCHDIPKETMIPLHAAFATYHLGHVTTAPVHLQDRRKQTIRILINEDEESLLISCTVACGPMKVIDTTIPSNDKDRKTELYSVFLAATCEVPEDILYEMLRKSPHVVERQRELFQGS